MTSPFIVKATLLASGLVASAVGGGILLAPHAFHATAGIHIADDVNLINEMRAAGGLPLVLGLFALYAVIHARLHALALSAMVTVYLSYGVARLVSFVTDGMPNAAMVQITVLELAIGALCLFALRKANHVAGTNIAVAT